MCSDASLLNVPERIYRLNGQKTGWYQFALSKSFHFGVNSRFPDTKALNRLIYEEKDIKFIVAIETSSTAIGAENDVEIVNPTIEPSQESRGWQHICTIWR